MDPVTKLDRRSLTLVWIASFLLWTLIAILSALPLYRWQRMFDHPATFWSVLSIPLLNNLIYAAFTPILIQIGLRYPLQRNNWPVRTLFYSAGALAFTAAHVLVRILVYPVKDSMTGQVFPVGGSLFERVFLYDFAADCFYTYIPILVATHAVRYYLEARDRELKASQLETRLAQAQLKALKSQLQPHFLFNTLHSISALMMTDVQAADRMMTRLSELLRMSLEDSGWQETTLNRELQFVQGYLEIERMRFSERLNVRFAIDSDTLAARVPHLLLQPLVENAVRHGISRTPDRGEIWIGAQRQGDELQLQIGDNGPGFAAGTSHTRSSGHGVGLMTTRERLYGLYGHSALLEVRSTPGKGTIVRVQLPFNTEPLSRAYELESIHGLV